MGITFSRWWSNDPLMVDISWRREVNIDHKGRGCYEYIDHLGALDIACHRFVINDYQGVWWIFASQWTAGIKDEGKLPSIQKVVVIAC